MAYRGLSGIHTDTAVYFRAQMGESHRNRTEKWARCTVRSRSWIRFSGKRTIRIPSRRCFIAFDVQRNLCDRKMDLRYNPPKAYPPKPYSKTHPLKTYPTKPDQKSDPEKRSHLTLASKSYPEKRTRQNLTLKHYPEKRTPQNLIKKAIMKNIPHESLPQKAIPKNVPA